MTETLTAPATKFVARGSYSRLRDQVKETLLLGKKRAEALVEKEKTKTYWEVGKLIDQHIKGKKESTSERAAYGRRVVVKLAEDLGIDRTTLYYSLELTRANPIVPPVGQLEWSLHRLLLSVNDKTKRDSLAEQAEKFHWSRRTLEAKIAKLNSQQKLIEKKTKPPRNRSGFGAALELRSGRSSDFAELIARSSEPKRASGPNGSSRVNLKPHPRL